MVKKQWDEWTWPTSEKFQFNKKDTNIKDFDEINVEEIWNNIGVSNDAVDSDKDKDLEVEYKKMEEDDDVDDAQETFENVD